MLNKKKIEKQFVGDSVTAQSITTLDFNILLLRCFET